MTIKEIKVKSALVKSRLPSVDYVVNCYVGCGFACSYCYASFMGRMVGRSVDEWGSYVYAKVNTPDLLKKELEKFKNKGKGKKILFSSVTDPFQAAESRYRLTQKCLSVLADFGFEGNVSILTKSPGVLKVVSLLKSIRNVQVGITVTAADDKISRYFEKFAPSASSRIKTLELLNRQGINTYAFVGPLLPHYADEVGNLESVFKSIYKTGTRDVYVEHINLSPYIKKRMINELKDTDKKFWDKFYLSQNNDYQNYLNRIIYRLVQKYNFNLLYPDVIIHNRVKNVES